MSPGQNVLADLEIEFPIREPFGARFTHVALQFAADLLRQTSMCVPRKYLGAARYAHGSGART